MQKLRGFARLLITKVRGLCNSKYSSPIWKKMFNIFEEEGEPMQEEAKLMTLFEKVQHVNFQKTVEALKVQ